jgi:FKBP-type peptidyl-prolyl cis-trans isomerase FkpA
MNNCTGNFYINKRKPSQQINNYLSLIPNKVYMKQFFSLSAAIFILFTSCKKQDRCPYTDSGISASTTERTYLQNYLSTNSIAALEHTSGVFYNIALAGSGAIPSICSTITVKYSGSIIPSGTVFDATTAGSSGSNFTLGELITGWQKALPLIKSGGKITLYIPPSLGYGQQNTRDNNGNIIIPGNSYLKFEIELVNVQ